MAPDTDRTVPPETGTAATYPGQAIAGTAAATLAVALSLVWIAIGDDLAVGPRTAIIAAALAAHGATMWLGRHRPPMRMALALGLAGLGLAGAVALPLHRSQDLYLYDLYGRMVVEGANPYVDPPSTMDDDPVFPQVSEDWVEQRSLYGPVFVGAAAPLSLVAGTSTLGVRLAWQLASAAAVAGSLTVVARSTRDPAAVLALGCSPVVLTTVNDAHNDVLVGLALVGAVVLVSRDRPVAAGFAAAVALGTKLIAAVPLAGLSLWLLLRRGTGHAARMAAPVIGVLAVGYLAAGGPDALRPLRENSGDDSRYALWQPLRDDLFETLRADGWRFRPTLEHVRDQVATYALLLLVVSVLVVLWRYRRATEPAEVTVATGLAYLIVATYVVPWYPAALIPVAALVWRSRAATLLWVQAALLMLAYAEPPGTEPSSSVGVWLAEGGATWVGSALLVALLVWCRPTTVGVRGVVVPPVSSRPT